VLHRKIKTHFESSWLPPENPIDQIQLGFNRLLPDLLDRHPALNSKANHIVRLLKAYKNRGDIRIVQSDKNLGLVAIDTQEYDRLVQCHLPPHNTDVIPTPHLDPSLGIQGVDQVILSNVTRNLLILPEKFTVGWKPVVEEHARLYQRGINLNAFTEQEMKFLRCTELKIPKFHVIIKLHKMPIASRPIVGATSWITTNWSTWVTLKLQEHFRAHPMPHVLRNTQEAITTLRRTHQHGIKLTAVSFDVAALYPSIKLELLYSHLSRRFPPFIVEVIKFICKNNYFCYRGRTYHQTQGIAMGTNAAVEMANYYMTSIFDVTFYDFLLDLAIQYIQTVGEQWMNGATIEQLFILKRYIDDVLLLVPEDFWRFYKSTILQYIDTHFVYAGLRFTYVEMNPTLPFLDIEIFQNMGILAWKTFQKSMNRYLYLSPDSCHPKHTLEGYITGELLRFKRNSYLKHDYEVMRRKFFNRLLDRGFTHYDLIIPFLKVTWDSTNATPGDSNQRTVAFVIPYSRRKIPIASQIHQFVQTFDSLKPFLDTIKFIYASHTRPNVTRITCSSAITDTEEKHLKDLIEPVFIDLDQSIPPGQDR